MKPLCSITLIIRYESFPVHINRYFFHQTLFPIIVAKTELQAEYVLSKLQVATAC